MLTDLSELRGECVEIIAATKADHPADLLLPRVDRYPIRDQGFTITADQFILLADTVLLRQLAKRACAHKKAGWSDELLNITPNQMSRLMGNAQNIQCLSIDGQDFPFQADRDDTFIHTL
ncbi:Uncharacterised protein [Vibrio cholerae]|nr:Uncharacterised protein [Vibrio cholerae]CSB43019.1 Uncharacterised protein [Vibrio cholerae]CSB45159.1 Uncharacterised protein [Vibrio cholerae]CSB49567.1 Uncharacterised protein [Vibrio cholerae]CSB51703.1 Uncharacterised protein [Vibrio cholerae]